ncbi:MAG: hypothetical protein GF418_17590 [Chitinivibrionales bacterium]|nr:hypothetical protein [Chitinivibrionales bacterium]MBD3397435.1 hypothetical protein [Chitinivibrionales bacterium]
MRNSRRRSIIMTLSGVVGAFAIIAVFTRERIGDAFEKLGESTINELRTRTVNRELISSLEIARDWSRADSAGVIVGATVYNHGDDPVQARLQIVRAGTDSLWVTAREFWFPASDRRIAPRDSSFVRCTLSLETARPRVLMRVVNARR